MTRRPLALALATLAALVCALPGAARAQTASCGCSTASGTPLGACLDDIRALPADPLVPTRVVNDIFHTADGHDARTLTFATYYRGLAGSSLAGCIGVSSNLYEHDGCPGCDCPSCTPTVCTSYLCTSTWDQTAATVHQYADHLDWKWWQLNRGTFESSWMTPVADQVHDCANLDDVAHCSYNPAHGFIYDLGGEANRVAIFAVTDHTDNCLEPFEWSVWLTDNPDATDVVPAGGVPDPTKWNRARLDQIFLQGWTRNPAAVGLPTDTHDLNDASAGDALSDSPTVVFSLACGLTFRYASIVSGNPGNPGPHCQFDSSEDEVDAVAGLNADNTRICPDADGDGFRDAACGGGDCNDMDPAIHPGAVETCATGHDANCDGVVDACPTGTTCVNGFCAPGCVEGACADGFTCTTGADSGVSACLPSGCAAMTCPAGQVCGPMGCQDPCAGAHCPLGQVCRGGACLDPCAGLACPVHQHCAVDDTGNGRCVIDCSCTGCTAPALCNARTGRCDAPDCNSIPCDPPGVRDCTGTAARCVAPCDGVTCPVGQQCDPSMMGGACVRDACFGVACQPGEHCDHGACVADARPDAGGVMDSGSGGSDGGAARDAGDAGPRSDDGRPVPVGSSCGCRAAGRSGAGGAGAAAMVVMALVAAARRRRSSRMSS